MPTYHLMMLTSNRSLVCVTAFVLVGVMFSFTLPAWAQHTIHGVVTDAETGAPLPGANLLVRGAPRGTITNAEGRYTLHLDELPATVRVRYIGYVPVERRITAAQQDFALRPVTVELEEVVVTADRHPARDIMRKVIRRKQARRRRLESYRADAYNRFTLANDTGIVVITESLTEWLWSEGRGSREIVKSQRATANLDLDTSLPAGLFVMDLYDDNIEVAGHTLVGITHPDALDAYAFQLEGVRALGDQVVYDISVRPESQLTSGFVGHIAVLDSTYAMIEARLRPSKAVRFPPPIQHFEVTYRQQWARFGTDFWLPTSFRLSLDLKAGLSGLFALPAMHLDQVARLTNYRVNIPVPDSLFEDDDHLRVDTAAVVSDSPLAAAGPAVPLTAREASAYEAIDSTMTPSEAFAPTGLLPRLADVDLTFGTEGEDSSEEAEHSKAGALSFSYSPHVWFNRVDALHAALEARLYLGDRFTLFAHGGYKTGLRQAAYGAGIAFDLGSATSLRLGYAYAVDPRWTSRRYGRLLGSVQVLLAKPDYFDYYGNERLRLTFRHRFSDLDLGVALRFSSERHFSVEKTTGWDVLASEYDQFPNPPVPEGKLRALRATVVWGDEEAPLGLTGRRRLRLSIEHSFPELMGSDFDFTRLSGAIDYTIDTFFRRRFLPMELNLRLTGGYSWGALPPQRFGIVEASLRPYSPFGVLHTLSNRPYEGSRHLAFFWEHNFRTVPFELLGLDSLVRWGWELIIGGAHARTWIPDDRWATLPYVPHVPDGFHHELTLSINRVLGLFRIGFSKRLDAEGFAISLAAGRLF